MNGGRGVWDRGSKSQTCFVPTDIAPEQWFGDNRGVTQIRLNHVSNPFFERLQCYWGGGGANPPPLTPGWTPP